MLTTIAATFLLRALNAAAENSPGPFTPQSIEYVQLKDHRLFIGNGIQKLFQSALEKDGIVTVSAIPGYVRLHKEMLEKAHLCARSMPEKIARGHFFEDGTKRLTLAMSGRSGDLPLEEFKACPGLKDKLNAFRNLVSEVSHTFFDCLDSILDLKGEPLFYSSDAEGLYETTADIFLHGEHLDHIHSYNHQAGAADSADMSTMDFHTDQGLAIAFAPAIMLDEETPHSMPKPQQSTGKFEIMLRSGDHLEVRFPHGHLVFMLGDGVNQYVNPKKLTGPDLYATPHAMTMPKHSSSHWRIWFGRMFLPPADALHRNGLTQTQLRNGLLQAWSKNDSIPSPHLHLACSRGLAQELRQLSTDPPCSSGARRRCSGNCANNQLQCWWRCMNFTELVGPDVCAEQNLGFNCTNRRDEISIGGVQHGDYNLACTNSTQPVRDNCELEQINAVRPAKANAAGFETFIASQGKYDGRHDLQLDGSNDTEVAFLWAVDAGKVNGLLAFNGELSWISFGIENVGGPLRGMKGGEVLFGVSSKDKEFPDLVGVNEYKIDLVESRFRHWNTPYQQGNSAADSMLIEENGFTALKFTTSSIYGKALNMTGSNRLMWAIRASTYMHIGKDSYHEGCKGGERIRYRGGGEDHPWIVDFSDTTSTCCVAKMPEEQISGCRGKAFVWAAMLMFGVRQLAHF